jgi:N-acetylglucosaminyl-diphospho-decaprenol L-rhamnosyltransferase
MLALKLFAVQQESMIDISIIFVAFRTPESLLNRSIESVIQAASFADVSFEVLIVDNGELSPPLLHYKELRVLGDGTNVGFGQAVNLAIESATGADILLMNPDSIIEPSGISELMAARTKHQSPGVYGALLLNDGVPQVHAYNVWWSSTHLMLRKSAWRRQLDDWIARREPVPVNRLCGAGLFGAKSDLVPLGPFDDDFFLYGEDVDFSLRAQKAGLATVMVPAAVIHHDAGSSSGAPSSTVERARTDAYFRYAIRHASLPLAYAGRVESIVVALAGSIRPRQTPQARQNRLSRLREIRRWGFHKLVGRFDPSKH